MKTLVLGTQSRYKVGLFEKLGLPFSTAKPPYEEQEVPGLEPEALARFLAEGKAASLCAAYPTAHLIGADQVLALGNRVFHKPGTVDEAVTQLLELSGKTHTLYTAFCLLDAETGERIIDCECSTLRFWPDLDPKYLRELVIRDATTDCVGAYKFESGGILLMEHVQIEDPNAIVGLPLLRLARALGQWGYLRERFRNNAPGQ